MMKRTDVVSAHWTTYLCAGSGRAASVAHAKLSDFICSGGAYMSNHTIVTESVIAIGCASVLRIDWVPADGASEIIWERSSLVAFKSNFKCRSAHISRTARCWCCWWYIVLPPHTTKIRVKLHFS